MAGHLWLLAYFDLTSVTCYQSLAISSSNHRYALTPTHPTLGPLEFSRLAQLLSDLHSWLASAAFDGAAVVLLRGAGEALSRCEQMVRASGQVRCWEPEVVRALVELVKVYAELMERCPHGAATVAANPGLDRGISDRASVGSRGAENGREGSGRAGESGERGGGAVEAAQVSAVVQLTVRADLLQVVIEALDLVHFDASFSRAPEHNSTSAATAGGRGRTRGSGGEGQVVANDDHHAVLVAALPLWNFLRGTVRFAVVHAAVAGQTREWPLVVWEGGRCGGLLDTICRSIRSMHHHHHHHGDHLHPLAAL